MGPELQEKLIEDWTALAKKQPQTIEFLKSSTKKQVGDSWIGFFNKKLDINRFFIEDSDGKKAANDQMAGVEFGNGQVGFADNSDPFENELEEALCVFKSGDGNTDIIEKN